MGEASDKVGADRRAVLGGAALLTAAVATRAFALPFIGGGDGGSGGEAMAKTAYGAVRGQVEGGINVFRGIPYGAPTAGGARFMPPEPPKPWGGVREAKRFGDQCPQIPPPPTPEWSSWAINTGESEDCLVLNV